MIRKFWKQNWYYLVGISVGAIGGYLYWYLTGCENGCSISGNPLNSSLYFALIGGIAASLYNNKH
jgi:phage shock protein E